jgi:hypothetical protein
MIILLPFIPLITSNLYKDGEQFTNNYNTTNDVIENDVVKYDIISALYLLMLGYNSNYYYRWGIIDKICIALLYILTFLISIFSAYLSFTCDWKGMFNDITIRLLFAFSAFMLGPFYLVWFFLINYLGKMC